jgi:hypothetical protein
MKIQFHTGPGQKPAIRGSVSARIGSFPGLDFLSRNSLSRDFPFTWDAIFSKKVAADKRASDNEMARPYPLNG